MQSTGGSPLSADELVTLYLLMRRVLNMGNEYKYRDHPFRKRLKKLMFSAYEVQGLTYGDIVKETGISYSAMNSYSVGVHLPGSENLLKLADYFGVSTDYLLGREGYETEENKWS